MGEIIETISKIIFQKRKKPILNSRHERTIKMKKLLIPLAIGTLSACSTMEPKKVIIDKSPFEKPDWVESPKLTWSDDGRIYFKSSQTIRGNQRLNGCYTLAANQNREQALREMAEEMKGATDEAQTDLNENAELILNKVRSGKWEGRIYGLRDEEHYFERYQFVTEATEESVERIDCYAVSSMKISDYNRTKNDVVNKVKAVDPKLREAIAKKTVDFFKSDEDRKPSSEQ